MYQDKDTVEVGFVFNDDGDKKHRGYIKNEKPLESNWKNASYQFKYMVCGNTFQQDVSMKYGNLRNMNHKDA